MRLVLATLHTRGLQEGEVWPSGMLSEGRGSYVWGHAVRGGGIAPSLGAVTFREAVWGDVMQVIVRPSATVSMQLKCVQRYTVVWGLLSL